MNTTGEKCYLSDLRELSKYPLDICRSFNFNYYLCNYNDIIVQRYIAALSIVISLYAIFKVKDILLRISIWYCILMALIYLIVLDVELEIEKKNCLMNNYIKH